MSWTISKYKLIEKIPLLYCILIFLKFYIGPEYQPVNNIVASLFILIGFGANFFFLSKLKNKSFIFYFIFLFLSSSIITALFSSNYRVQDLILIYSYIGFGLIPIFQRLNYLFFKMFAYLVIAFFVYLIFVGVDASEVFNVSRNFISIFLLIVVGYHIISSYQNQLTPSFLIIILCSSHHSINLLSGTLCHEMELPLLSVNFRRQNTLFVNEHS